MGGWLPSGDGAGRTTDASQRGAPYGARVNSFTIWLVPTAVTALACVLGWRARRAGARWWSPGLAVLAGGIAAIVVVTALVLREPGVPVEQFLFGVALGALGLAVLPVLAFYSLGYYVRRPRLAGGLWVLGTFPLGIYIWLVGFVFLFGVACEPGCVS